MKYRSVVKHKKIWPWDRALPADDRTGDSETPLPRISVVTPSYNQGEFIEETIRSVVLQEYPDLEYFIMDAASTDETTGVIERHSRWITSWVSEPDNGQSHAVNKGWRRANGEILGWLNSDDVLAPDALMHVAAAFRDRPECVVVVGKTIIADRELNPVYVKDAYHLDTKRILWGSNIPAQPSVFLRKTVFETLGGLDEDFHFSLDREYWTRISMAYPPESFCYVDATLSIAREYPGNKSSVGGKRQARERLAVLDRAFSNPNLPPSLAAMRNEAYAGTKFRIAAIASLSGNPLLAWQSAFSSWTHKPTVSYLLRVILLCAKAVSPVKRTRHPLYARTSKASK